MAIAGRPGVSPDTEWFTDAKFGLFMHFGLYSIPGGVWDGRPMGRNSYSEWIRYQQGWPDQQGMPREEYDRLLLEFEAPRFDADLICREAAAAGMRYFVLTTKHHDGFALWPSGISDYSVAQTPCRRDLVGEMVVAGRRYGLKIGFYYSHWLDWEYPGGGLPPWPEAEGDHAIQQPSDNEYDRYWDEKCIGQVGELIDGYAPDLFWFDSWGNNRAKQLTEARLQRLLGFIRERSPHTLINSRIGTETGADYLSMGDNQFPNRRIERPWETSATMNRSWGYSRNDHNFRPTTELLRRLVDNVSRGGNLQLNIGPKGDGSVEPAVLRRLRDLAAWMSVNGHAVHGTRPVDAEEPGWGRLVRRGETIYAHVYDWPADGRLILPRLPRPAVAATVCETEAACAIEGDADRQVVVLPHRCPDDRIAVIEIAC